MTREEAVNTLGNFKRYISGGGVTDLKANDAIDMAIEALQILEAVERIKTEILPQNKPTAQEDGEIRYTGENYKI